MSGSRIILSFLIGASALLRSPPCSGVIALRPEIVEIWDSAGAAPALDYRFRGRVQNRIYLGDQTEFSIAVPELGELLVRVPKAAASGASGFAPGAEVGLGWRREGALALADG